MEMAYLRLFSTLLKRDSLIERDRIFYSRPHKAAHRTSKMALVIVLGSNFLEYQETGFGFMSELLKKNFHLVVCSLDRRELNAQLKARKVEEKAIDVFRSSVQLEEDSLANFFTKEILSDYQIIILVDSIHRYGYSPACQKALAVFQGCVPENAELRALHYIGSVNESPALNRRDLPFVALLGKAKLEQLYKDFFTGKGPGATIDERKKKVLQNMLSAIKDDSSSEDENKFFSFLSQQFTKLYGPELARQFRRLLDVPLIANIRLEQLEKVHRKVEKEAEKLTDDSMHALKSR